MIRLMILILSLFITFCFSSCNGGENGDNDDNEESITRDVEDLLTIDQGVYGQVTSHNDIGYNPIEYFPGFSPNIS